jgi:hypothetical protein
MWNITAAVGLIRQAWTPLFLLSDKNTEPSDESYVDEAKGSSVVVTDLLDQQDKLSLEGFFTRCRVQVL